MLIAGHRGASGTEPENTLTAFKAALAMGADAVELDVQRCKSGEMMVIHDSSVDRTSNGSGKVKDLTLDQLKQLDFGNGEPIQTLDEVLDALKGGCKNGKNPTVFIEVKSPGAREVAKSIEQAVQTKGYSYAELPVIGFNPKQVGAVKLVHPKVSIGVSMSSKRCAAEKAMLIPLAKTLHASAINPEHTMVTEDLVNKAHAAGLKVNVWTVNEHADIKRMAELGVDSIMSDHPDRAKRVAQATAKPAPNTGIAI